MKIKIEVRQKSLSTLITSAGIVKLVNGIGYIEDITEDQAKAMKKEVAKVGEATILSDGDKVEKVNENKEIAESKGIAGTQDTLSKLLAVGSANGLPNVQ